MLCTPLDAVDAHPLAVAVVLKVLDVLESLLLVALRNGID